MTDKKPEMQSRSALSGAQVFFGCKDMFSFYHQLMFYGLLVLYITSMPNNILFELFPLCCPLLPRGLPTPPSEMWMAHNKLLLTLLIASSHWRQPLLPLKSSPQNCWSEWEKGNESYLALNFLLVPPMHHSTQLHEAASHFPGTVLHPYQAQHVTWSHASGFIINSMMLGRALLTFTHTL